MKQNIQPLIDEINGKKSLDDETKQKAIAAIERMAETGELKVAIPEAIYAFSWKNTPQGFQFWARIHEAR